MLYTNLDRDWSPGQPLTPTHAGPGLFRTREEAAKAAPGRPTLAVAVRFDPTRGVVLAMPPAALAMPGGWSAPAILDDGGGVTVFAPIPAPLVRLVGPASIRMHAGRGDRGRGPHRPASIPSRMVPGRAARNR